MKVLSRLKIESTNNDQRIREFISNEVIEEYISDGALNRFVRAVLFSNKNKIDWNEALSVLKREFPELKNTLLKYGIESSTSVTSTPYDLDELEIVENLGKDKDWKDFYFVLVKKDDDYAAGTYDEKKKFVLVDKNGWKDVPEIAIADLVGGLEEMAHENDNFAWLIRSYDDFDFGDGKYSKIFKNKYNAMVKKYR